MDKFLQEAIEAYERNINSTPPFYMDADTLMQIEEYYEKNGRNFDAQQCLHYAELLHPDDTEVLIAKAYQLKADGRWDEAEQIIKSIPNQNHREVVLYKAEWFAMSGMPDKAEQMAARHIGQDLDDATLYDWYVDISEVLMNYGYVERAIAWLRKIDAQYYDYRHVLELLADACTQLQDYKHALEAAQRMTDLDPYDANAWCLLADIQQKRGDYGGSLESAEYALAIDPMSKLGMSLKVFDTFALNNKNKALGLVENYTCKMPTDYSMAMYAAENMLTDSDFDHPADVDKALHYLLGALGNCPQGNPDRVRLLTDLSMLYARMKDAPKAEEALMATLSAGVSLTDILWKVHYVLYNSGMKMESIKSLERLANINDMEKNDRVEIFKILVRNQWYEEARGVWEALVHHRHEVDDPYCLIHLTYSFYRFKDKERFMLFLYLCLLKFQEETLRFFAQVFHKDFPDFPENASHDELTAKAKEISDQWDAPAQ